jgi:hypothetical protein
MHRTVYHCENCGVSAEVLQVKRPFSTKVRTVDPVCCSTCGGTTFREYGYVDSTGTWNSPGYIDSNGVWQMPLNAIPMKERGGAIAPLNWDLDRYYFFCPHCLLPAAFPTVTHCSGCGSSLLKEEAIKPRRTSTQ